MTTPELLLALGVLSPLVFFAILVFFGSRLGKPASGYVACAGISISCILSIAVLVMWYGGAREQSAPWVWATIGTVPVAIGVNLDSLTVIMFFMVSFVSACIFFFSLGYMSGHSDEIDGVCMYHRFFTFLSLFCFSMLGLVVANNILFLFIFWELVGLCSYFLIGFYFHKKSASDAGIKAFVVNRVGDFGFLIGLMMVFSYLGDITLSGSAATFQAAAYHAGVYHGPLTDAAATLLHDDPARVAHAAGLFGEAGKIFGVTLATWMGIGLFCGAIGKSAQFPLHVWLPDAMEGPTPVSALIHAATMVAAGVYLVARIFLLLTPGAQTVIAVIGCITLTIAALLALVQTDIKRVLAYSTVSQLGYMIFGMGVGAWIAALFHLLTHAFFKALLFLGSGQVIEGCHHVQDMRKMGGLRHKMPVTCWTFFIALLAISGAGIPWLGIGIGGYYSKDEILAVAYHRGFGGVVHAEHEPGGHGEGDAHAASGSLFASTAYAEKIEHAELRPAEPGSVGETFVEAKGSIGHMVMFFFAMAVAYVTPFYMMRCWYMTFCGRPRDKHVFDHAHEIPLMYVPLAILAAGTMVSGLVLFRPMVAQSEVAAWLAPAFDGHHDVSHAAHTNLGWMVGFAFVVGLGLAYLLYKDGLQRPAALVARWRLRPVQLILEQKYYLDHLYGLTCVGGTMLASKLSRFGDLVIDTIVDLLAILTERLSAFSGWVLDARGVDGLANAAYELGGVVRTPQTGRVRNYVLFLATAAVVALIVIGAFAFGE
jgi:proton-translocating NADH-quinone oxidoreductase chain L